jgi:hypothetical protein
MSADAAFQQLENWRIGIYANSQIAEQSFEDKKKTYKLPTFGCL